LLAQNFASSKKMITFESFLWVFSTSLVLQAWLTVLPVLNLERAARFIFPLQVGVTRCLSSIAVTMPQELLISRLNN